ncbi:MAG: glycosyltransferase family 4 protein [Paramuribaculum sp.]|nr:glycosyltransferase family 4 protein [Paramuribaculum sp.]
MSSNKIIRGVTVSMSVGFFDGLIPELREMGYEVVSVSSDGPELERVRNAGGRAIVVPMERHISPVKDIKSLWQMIRVFRHERPSMVHSMTPKAGLVCMIAAMLTRVPVRVHTFTGLVFPTATGLKRQILMATDRLTCACATHIIPEGEGVKADLLNNNITRKPIRVLGHGNCRGIDLERFNPADESLNSVAETIRKPESFTFIFIGRIVRDKGINELAEAFSRLYNECPDSRLILVGPYEDNLDPISSQTHQTINSCPGIEAVGEQKDVRTWLLASDAFVFPSYREGFPNVVIEAGAMGLPSIVTDINGSREIIMEGRNGTIIPPRDAEALYKAMKSFIDHPTKTASMAAQARPLIASRYEQSYVRQCLKDFYKEIM